MRLALWGRLLVRVTSEEPIAVDFYHVGLRDQGWRYILIGPKPGELRFDGVEAHGYYQRAKNRIDDPAT